MDRKKGMNEGRSTLQERTDRTGLVEVMKNEVRDEERSETTQGEEKKKKSRVTHGHPAKATREENSIGEGV